MSILSQHFDALRLGLAQRPFARRNLRRALRYVRDRAAFVAAGGRIAREQPMLHDFVAPAGSANGHYFHQDLLVATRIHARAPRKHVDVGSRIDGFVAHVAAYREIEVFDIRPLRAVHPRIKFVQADLMSRAALPARYCDSLSCLHALEHFGLGRYGDPIDPDGHLRGFENLLHLLEPGGVLYLSVPIGAQATHFNAHRVFAPGDVLGWSAGRLALLEYAYVDDVGDLHQDCGPERTPALRYGCGIYTLQRS